MTELQIQLFKEALRAVHVTPLEDRWQVYRIGENPKIVAEESLAIEFAKKSAERYHISVLLHKSGKAVKLI